MTNIDKYRFSESPKSITAFGEDQAHKQVIGALINRVAKEVDAGIMTTWHSSRRGHGKVIAELDEYLINIGTQGLKTDLIVVATDANCKGYNERLKEISVDENPFLPAIYAIPDPHVERWLLLDSEAFKKVFGKGCKDIGYKCERHFYKKALIQACFDAGMSPYTEVMDYAENIVLEMDLNRAAKKDSSLK